MGEITDQAAAECVAIITRLAERKVECPGVSARFPDLPDAKVHNSTCCRGTGEVAEFPWLRRECNHSHRDRQTGQCLESGCHGWVPRLDIPIEEVLANLTQAQRMAVLSDVRLVVTVGDPADFRLAFWQAVEKVVSNGRSN